MQSYVPVLSSTGKRMSTPGFIYAIRVIETDFVKIGMTRGAVHMRLALLQAGNHLPLEVITYSAALHNPRTGERSMHSLVMPSHVRGEWFPLPNFTPGTFCSLLEKATQAMWSQEQTIPLPHRIYRKRNRSHLE